jgi:hypothetical protein
MSNNKPVCSECKTKPVSHLNLLCSDCYRDLFREPTADYKGK